MNFTLPIGLSGEKKNDAQLASLARCFSFSSAHFSLWLFYSPSPEAYPHTIFTFILSCYFFLFGLFFPSFLLIASRSSFFFSHFFSHLFSYLLKALANEDTLLRTHCCQQKCFPVSPRAQHLLRTQILCPGPKKRFWFRFINIVCPQQCVLVYQAFSAFAAILLHEISAALILRGFEVRTPCLNSKTFVLNHFDLSNSNLFLCYCYFNSPWI